MTCCLCRFLAGKRPRLIDLVQYLQGMVLKGRDDKVMHISLCSIAELRTF